MMSCRHMAFWGLTFLGAAGCGGALSQVDSGPPLTDADLAMGWSQGDNSAAGDFAEQLVVRAVLADGGDVYTRLLVTNIAGADGRAQLRVAITTGDGRRIEQNLRASRADWTFASDRFHVALDGATVDVGIGGARVTLSTEELDMAFEVEALTAPLRPLGGRLDRGGQFYVTTIPIPRGRARLTLKVHDAELWRRAPAGDGDEDPDAPVPDGPDALSAEGIGYAEHRWGNVPPYELALRWHNLLIIGPDETVVLSAFERPNPSLQADEAKEPGPVYGWLFAAGDEGLRLYAPELSVRAYGYSQDPETPYRLPQLVYVSDPAQLRLKGVLALGSLSHRKDDLDGLKKIERIVVRRFMQPFTFRYDAARYLFRARDPATGAVEVRGQGRYMFQQVRE